MSEHIFKTGDYVYANGHREPGQWRDSGEHFFGTDSEMERWEQERVQLVVTGVPPHHVTPSICVSRVQPCPITGTNYTLAYHPHELTLGVPPPTHEELK